MLRLIAHRRVFRFVAFLALWGLLAFVHAASAAGAAAPSPFVYRQTFAAATADYRTNPYISATVMSGTTALVSQNYALVGQNSGQGIVYCYTKTTTWGGQTAITASDGASYNIFGSAVSLDANTLLVGAPGRNRSTGAVYVFTRTGSNCLWTQTQILTANDGIIYNSFGSAVALSGNTAYIGAPGRATYSGGVYVFSRDPNSGVWTQTGAPLLPQDTAHEDSFGRNIALNGTTVVISSDKATYQSTFPFRTITSGMAYIYINSGTTLTQQQQLVGKTGQYGFGNTCALDGDTLLLGQGYNAEVDVFTRTNGVWSLQATLKAKGSAKTQVVGRAVALKGDTAVLSKVNYGKVKPKDQTAHSVGVVFARTGTKWLQTQDLSVTDPNPLPFAGGLAFDGTTILASAEKYNSAGQTVSTAVYDFTR